MNAWVPNFGQIALLLLAVAFFIAGAMLSLTRLRRPDAPLQLVAKSIQYVGIAFTLAALIWHCINRGSWLPLNDNFEALATLGLLLAIFVRYVQRAHPVVGLDWFIMPIVILLLISAIIFGRWRPDVYHPYSTWLWVHIISTFGGFIAFAIAASMGCMYLVVSDRLRRKSAPAGPYLGSLERLENMTQVAVTWGFALLSLGLVSGLIRILHDGPLTQLGAHWMTRPKVLLGFAVWVVYALALHTPINSALRGRKSAMLSIVGFVLMFGTLVAVQFASPAQ